MVPDPGSARRLVELTDVGMALLTSPRRPIVLAPRRASGAVAPGVAPGLAELGVMLPYSPLHHVLLAAVGRPVVMTSGNLSDEPIAHTDDDAVDRLGPLVDGIMTHDRPIHIRCDDSVVRSRGDVTQVLRRSRGYAPEPIYLATPASRPVLALGAELKCTVAVVKGATVVASHHLGDLEHPATYRSFLQAIEHVCHLSGVTPEVVAHDSTPSTCRPSSPPSSTCPPFPFSTTTPTSPRAWSTTAAPDRCWASPSTGWATGRTTRCGEASSSLPT